MTTQKILNITNAIEHSDVILITSLYGSSGGAFLNTLFDEHPDLFTFAHAVMSYINYHDFARFSRAQHIAEITDDEIFFDSSLGNEIIRGDGFHLLGEEKDRGYQIDREKFIEYLNTILDEIAWNARNYTLAVVAAFNLARGIFPNSNAFVLYAHDMHSALTIEKHLGHVKIVATCRHPLNVFVSSCNQATQKAKDRSRLVGCMSYAMFGHFYDFMKAKAPIGLVVLEELHANPESSMRQLASFLGIRFDDALLRSTVCGLKWWGIRVSILNGFSSTLHREVKLAETGRNIEAAIFRSTKPFQLFVGYAQSSQQDLFDRFRGNFPGGPHWRYYRYATQQFMSLLSDKKRIVGSRVGVVTEFVKKLGYSIAYKIMDPIWIFRGQKASESVNITEKLQLVNPLTEQSINIVEHRRI